MTETALAPEADIAYEQLVQRNSELEEEKATLAEELEHTQGKRDAAIRRAQVAEDDRDALRTHVEVLNDKLGEVRDSLYGQGLQVAGWHLNGELEPLDSWFEDNDWEPVPFDQDSRARRDEPLISAVRKLVVAARTAGGTAGRDQGLCSALDELEEHLAHRQAEEESP